MIYVFFYVCLYVWMLFWLIAGTRRGTQLAEGLTLPCSAWSHQELLTHPLPRINLIWGEVPGFEVCGNLRHVFCSHDARPSRIALRSDAPGEKVQKDGLLGGITDDTEWLHLQRVKNAFHRYGRLSFILSMLWETSFCHGYWSSLQICWLDNQNSRSTSLPWIFDIIKKSMTGKLRLET